MQKKNGMQVVSKCLLHGPTVLYGSYDTLKSTSAPLPKPTGFGRRLPSTSHFLLCGRLSVYVGRVRGGLAMSQNDEANNVECFSD